MQAQRFIYAGDQEQQRYAIIFQNIAQPIKPIIPLAIGQQHMLVIQHLDKTGRIAARRNVIAPRALSAEQRKGAGGDEGARWHIQPVSRFVCGGL